MIGFEEPKLGEYSVVHEEFAGQKLGDVIDVICNGGTRKELKVATVLSLKNHTVITARLAEWPDAQNFRQNQDLELKALRDAVVDDVREVVGVVIVYVTTESVGIACR